MTGPCQGSANNEFQLRPNVTRTRRVLSQLEASLRAMSDLGLSKRWIGLEMV